MADAGHLLRTIPWKEITLGEKLGEGGFGVVYRGNWKHVREEVAIKKIKGEIGEDAQSELKKEAEITKRLDSPYIVRLWGLCWEKQSYAMVMELMPKASLYHLLHTGQELPWNVRYSIAQDMAYGLRLLHENKILHRDLKSLNVLLDDRFRAKLADFGLAKIKTQSRTTSKDSGGSVGTLAWMAPELFEGESCTEKTDLYAYGMTAWELASRETPFSQVANPHIIPVLVGKTKRPDIPADCPPGFTALIKRCWSQEPSERPNLDYVIDSLRQVIVKNPSTQSSPVYQDSSLDSLGMVSKPAAQAPVTPIVPIAAMSVKDKVKFFAQAAAKPAALVLPPAPKPAAAHQQTQDDAIQRQMEQLRLDKQKAEQERQALEQKLIQERQKAEQERLAREKAEQERQRAEQEKARLEQERHAEQLRLEKLRLDQDKQTLEQKVVQQQKAEQERLAREKVEQERQRAEHEKARVEQERKKAQELLVREKAEQERRKEQLQLEKQKAEKDGLAREVAVFLKLVVSGKQNEAEEALRKNAALARESGDVTDHANRNFTNITGFQYAVWALDWHMWKMILKYLPKDVATAQAQTIETGPWVRQHGVVVSWDVLLRELHTYIDNYKRWGTTQYHPQWTRVIGGAQKLLPIHVLQEYCHPDRSFDPTPSFKEQEFPRKLDIDISKLGEGGHKGGVGRGSDDYCRVVWNFGMDQCPNGSGCPVADRRALAALASVRSEQRVELLATLGVRARAAGLRA